MQLPVLLDSRVPRNIIAADAQALWVPRPDALQTLSPQWRSYLLELIQRIANEGNA
jgi:hypothetical protein